MMAQSDNGGSSGGWGLNTDKQQNLPPKSPWLVPMSNQGPLKDAINDDQHGFSGWQGFDQQSTKHQRTSSSIGFGPNAHSPSWLDEIINLPPSKCGGMHRRSASDSLAFGDAERLPHSEISDREAFHCGSSSAASIPRRDFDKLDDEQLLPMFSDIEPFNNQPNHDTDTMMNFGLLPPQMTPASTSENASTPSDHNSVCETLMEEKPATGVPLGQLRSEQEVQSVWKSERLPPNQQEQKQQQPAGSQPPANVDPSLDPKRVKRILANRQSAQRSRVRKLQYIAELERSVNALQTEVSTLSPEVAYLDHQRLVLNVENDTLKQGIAALAQDKLFKDAHCEALKEEIQSLRNLYYQQQHCLKNEGRPLAVGFGTDDQPMQHASDTNSSLMCGIEGNKHQIQSKNTEAINSNHQLLQPMSCLKSETSSNMAYPSDFMVHTP